MDQIVAGSVATPRFAFILVGLFAGLAILLAAIGTYGVISYSVTQRTPEFGLRMALGAQRLDVLRLVLSQAAKLVLSGTVDRSHPGPGPRPRLEEPDLRSQPDRSADLYRNRIRGHRRGNLRLLYSSAQSHRGRSDDRSA